MLQIVTLAAAILLGQGSSELTLSKARFTYGELGPVRPDNKFLPGDAVFLSFDISGIKTSEIGAYSYVLTIDVQDKAGKSVFKKSVDFDGILPLGGNKLRANPHLILPNDQVPGDYKFNLTVLDKGTKVSKTISKEFTLLPKAFGLVALQISNDDKGLQSTPLDGTVGEVRFLNFSVANFARDSKKKPNFEIELQIFEGGKPIYSKPFVDKVNDIFDEKINNYPAIFRIFLNREGKFTVSIKAIDHIAKKTSEYQLPLEVYPAK
jgi:hypothetical protein